MVAIIERPVEHMVLPHISWETYERILDEIGETHLRVSYHNGSLEFMTTSFEHEHFGEWIAKLVLIVAMELNFPLCSGGSTTLKRALAKAGLEPDHCYWVEHEVQMRNNKKWDAEHDPPPDLGIEVDITSGWLDRLEIYAALRVPEVWRFDGEVFRVLVLSANGKYRERNKSLAFPTLPMEGFARFVRKLGSAEEVSLLREFTQWLRSEVIEKKANGERKNGRR